MAIEIQIRRDTASNWTTVNPTLAEGELGLETNTNFLKIGDGTKAWTGLSYFSTGGSGGGVTELVGLTDVVITTPTNGQVLKYNTSTSKWINSIDSTGSGTVTSVAMTTPTGLSITGSPITTTGTLGLALTAGYAIPQTSSQTNWDTSYTNRITSLTTTGTSGAATLVSNVLNIPNHTLAGLGGQTLSTNLTSLSGLAYVSSSFVKMTSAGVFALDTTGYTTNTGTVTSVAISVPTGLSVTGSPVTTTGTLAVALTTGYAIPTTAKQTNWDTAFTNNLQWNGGATNLVAATGRTSLGATTIGGNMLTLVNPTAITFPRFNADNTVSALDAATFRAAIGAGTATTVSYSELTGSIPTWNQNTTGTSAGLSINLIVSKGGTGATSVTGTGDNVLSIMPKLEGTREGVLFPTITSGVLTLECGSASVFVVNLNSNISSLVFNNTGHTLPNTAIGITLVVTYGGGTSINWPTNVQWSNAIPPTLSGSLNTKDIFVLTSYDKGVTWFAITAGINFYAI